MARPSTLLVHSGTLVCMDRDRTVARGDVLVEDGVIAAVGAGAAERARRLPGGRADETFDATGAFVLPGLVQGHVHLCQTLFRGRAEQHDLLRWLRESIWPLEAAHTPASIAASARLGVLELLRGGVTCVNDMGTVRHTEAIGEVLAATGIRAVFGKALMDRGEGVPAALLEPHAAAVEGALAVAQQFHGAEGGRLRVSLAPRFILSCSEDLWRDAAAACAERGLVLHTHISESPSEGRAVAAAVSTTAARYFAEQGILGPGFVGAHGIWLEPDELDAMAGARAALVHCPGSNLKLGSGYADVRAWRRAGVRCGIGSDGGACNNRLDTFHEMSLAAGISRVRHADQPLDAREILALATCDGADALGWGEAVGSIEVGKQADLAVIDARGPHLAPFAEDDPYAAIVHAARDGDVRLTVVAGRVLYRDGRWTTLDAEHVAAEARTEARALIARVEVA